VTGQESGDASGIEGTAPSFSARMLLERTDGLPGRLRYIPIAAGSWRPAGSLRLIGMCVPGIAARLDESPFTPRFGDSRLQPGITRFQVNIENLGEGCLRPWPAKYSLQGDRRSAVTS
jgi:hypothetical protein